jgi:hypothetical protein
MHINAFPTGLNCPNSSQDDGGADPNEDSGPKTKSTDCVPPPRRRRPDAPRVRRRQAMDALALECAALALPAGPRPRPRDLAPSRSSKIPSVIVARSPASACTLPCPGRVCPMGCCR